MGKEEDSRNPDLVGVKAPQCVPCRQLMVLDSSVKEFKESKGTVLAEGRRALPFQCKRGWVR